MLKRSVRDLTRGSSSVDSQWLQKQMEELSTRWDLVCKLSVSKQARLEAALRQVRAGRAGGGWGGQQPAQGLPGRKGRGLQPVHSRGKALQAAVGMWGAQGCVWLCCRVLRGVPGLCVWLCCRVLRGVPGRWVAMRCRVLCGAVGLCVAVSQGAVAGCQAGCCGRLL